MRSFMVVEVEVGSQAGSQLTRGVILVEIDVLYMTLRDRLSQKTLSRGRPRPSMLTWMLAASRQAVNALAVNCAPWWVFKILGRALFIA